MKRLCAVAALACWLPAATPQQPEVINGKMETRPVNGSLTQEFHKLEAASATPLWAAYTVPMVQQQGQMCGIDERRNNLVRLEGPDTMVVLLRFENRALDRVRVSSLDCQFDAGGLPFIYLAGVTSAQSVDLLAGLARTWSQMGRKPHFDSIITAIALDRDAAADTALESMAAPSESETLREKVLFWLANARGKRGFEAVKRILQSDPSDRIREKATFALSVSKEPGVNQALEDAARNDRTPRVRSQALFWLAHKAGLPESAMILKAAQQDPSPEVRRQAVFALEQIPQGAGIPLLIQLVRTSSDPKVKEQAMFWLGRSRDPQAIKFIDDVIK